MNTSILIKKGPAVQHVGYDVPFQINYYYRPYAKQHFEFFQIQLNADKTYTSNGHSDKSLEYILVLEGELTLTVGVQKQVLTKDECVDFIACSKHSYQASGSTALKAIIIHYYSA